MNKSPQTITIRVSTLRLSKRSTFVRRVVEEAANTRTYREAFDKVNAEYEEVFGRPRYGSYESFRVVKSQEQNRGRNQLSLFDK